MKLEALRTLHALLVLSGLALGNQWSNEVLAAPRVFISFKGRKQHLYFWSPPHSFSHSCSSLCVSNSFDCLSCCNNWQMTKKLCDCLHWRVFASEEQASPDFILWNFTTWFDKTIVLWHSLFSISIQLLSRHPKLGTKICSTVRSL